MRRHHPPGRMFPHPRTPAGPRDTGQAVCAGSPAAVIAAVPCLLGFVPSRSLVVLGAGPPHGRVQVTLRFDLPDPPDAAAARAIAGHAVSVLVRQRQPLAVVIGYGPGRLVTPAADAIREDARRAGLDLRDLLRVEDGRFWSYLCAEPSCCPAEGVPVAGGRPAGAAPAVPGSPPVLPDRGALAATVAPFGGIARQSMRQATRRAEARATALAFPLSQPGRLRDARRRIVRDGLTAVARALATYRAGGQLATDDEMAWLAFALTSLRVRDDAWARMDVEHNGAHRRLWTDLVRRAEPRYVPAPASLLAFTAWQAGDGALANVALDRALEADPRYSMAILLRDALAAGAPPSAARLPMTPEEVAASYDAAESRPRGSAPGAGSPPDGDLPDGEHPEYGLRDGNLPDDYVPEEDLPEEDLPDGDLPDGDLPDEGQDPPDDGDRPEAG